MLLQEVTFKGVSLWTRQDGELSHPAILLIAGANASHLMWPDNFVNLLVNKGFRVIRYDHRDTGRSSKFDFDTSPYTVNDLAEDAIAVLDGLGILQAHIVGLSMGGSLVQAILLDHPQRVRSAVIMLTAALDVDFTGNIIRVYNGEPEPQGLPLPNRGILDQLAERGEPSTSEAAEIERRVREWVALSGTKAKLDPNEFRRWETASIEHAGTYVQPSNHARATPIPTQRGRELRNIRVPVLVIQGGQDPLNPPPHGEHIAQQIPNAKLLEIEELGHSLPSSLHTQIANAISEHCSKLWLI